MRLARIVHRNNNPWWYGDGTKINPPIGTIVQYEDDYGAHRVYFPGVSGVARIGVHLFREYFEDLDNETS